MIHVVDNCYKYYNLYLLYLLYLVKNSELSGILAIKIILTTTSLYNDSIQEDYDLEIASYESTFIGEKYLKFGGDKRNASVMVEYDSGLQVYSSDSKLLSKGNNRNNIAVQ